MVSPDPVLAQDGMALALTKVTTPGSLEIGLRNPSDITVPKLECMGAAGWSRRPVRTAHRMAHRGGPPEQHREDGVDVWVAGLRWIIS
jgi:hypothetical protein